MSVCSVLYTLQARRMTSRQETAGGGRSLKGLNEAGWQEAVSTESSSIRLGQEGCPEDVMSEDLGELSRRPRAQRG